MESKSLSTPADLGLQIAKLRKRAGKTQAEVARDLGVDSSKISRIEDGKLLPTEPDLTAILEFLGTKEARRYQKYLGISWQYLKQPPFDHPDLKSLQSAESSLKRIGEFRVQVDSKGLAAQASMYRDGLLRAASYLLDLRHTFGFIGPIGVGKTTGLCSMFGLVAEDDEVPLIERILLEYGAGGTTICEVMVRHGSDFSVIVEPFSEEEVIQFVNDFCDGLTDIEPTAEDSERGVPKEIDRAIRNMSGLKRHRLKRPDGKRATRDHAEELAKQLQPEALRAEVFNRIQLWNRTTTHLVHESAFDLDGATWLKETFAEINKGQKPDVGLPKRIVVVVPFRLMNGTPLDISVVDTKGIDGSPLRPDLKSCLEDPRMIVVLCSSFNEAPGPIFEQLLKQAIEAGPGESVFQRCVSLALAREGEARRMRDEGEFVETIEEGYELKAEQAQSELRRWGCGSIPAQVYNANADPPGQVLQFLDERVREVRKAQQVRIDQISAEIGTLIRDHENVLLAQAQEEVLRRLRIFVSQHKELPPRINKAHSRLLRAVREQHQRSVWATTTRSGNWPSLDAYYYLGLGTAVDAKRRANSTFDGLQELIANMIGDEKLAPAHGFLRELRNNAIVWRNEFIESVTRVGETSFQPALKAARSLWEKCADRYGMGPGYRDDVSKYVGAWFEDPSQDQVHALLEQHVVNSWEQRFIAKLTDLCDSSTS